MNCNQFIYPFDASIPGLRMKVSVIIPSHNRPVLLHEAIESVRCQSYPDWELIIVDDGSQPPIDARQFFPTLGDRLRVVRNEQPRTQPFARDQGVQVATGQAVVHLDDDDLLAPNALERALSALHADPTLQLVFLGVKGFGANAEHFDSLQTGDALTDLIHSVTSTELRPGLFRFAPDLFCALLISVPMAFQRSLEYTHVWQEVSAMRRKVYQLESALMTDDETMGRLQPPLRESEWAIYAAAICQTALINEPLYLQRCDRQGYYSITEKKAASVRSRVDIAEHLLLAAKNMVEFRAWRSEIRAACERAWFDRAYDEFQNAKRVTAWSLLARAATRKPQWRHFRFALRTLLPAGIAKSS